MYALRREIRTDRHYGRVLERAYAQVARLEARELTRARGAMRGKHLFLPVDGAVLRAEREAVDEQFVQQVRIAHDVGLLNFLFEFPYLGFRLFHHGDLSV